MDFQTTSQAATLNSVLACCQGATHKKYGNRALRDVIRDYRATGKDDSTIIFEALQLLGEKIARDKPKVKAKAA